MFIEYEYAYEAEYKKMIVANAETNFGTQGIYFDIKKKIGKLKDGILFKFKINIVLARAVR